MKLKLREGWVMGMQGDGCYWYGKTSDDKAFTLSAYTEFGCYAGVKVCPEHNGKVIWICTTMEMAHESLVDNGFESPFEVVE